MKDLGYTAANLLIGAIAGAMIQEIKINESMSWVWLVLPIGAALLINLDRKN